MEKNYNTDDFLAKWASKELSKAEKEAFEKTEDYKYYQAILEGTDILDVPLYDKEKLFNAVQKDKFAKPKVIHLVPRWAYAVAASFALIFGYLFFFNQAVSHETGYGEQLAIKLPDNSEVILNAKSKLEYKNKNWEEERTLSLEGNAYFKVEKGSTFTVGTNNGFVTVLGTQFTVNSDSNIFEVICYEGKVKVESNDQTKTIVKGQAIRFVDTVFEDWNINQQTPSWIHDETTFNNAPLEQVIRALEKQYEITINATNVDTNLRFTGSFTHTNLKTAVRTVFESLEIKCTFKDENTIDLVLE